MENMKNERFRKFVLLVENIHKSVQKIKLGKAREFGVKGVHLLWVYDLLCHPEGMKASELASNNMINRSLISREMEPLIKEGYIEEIPNESNRLYNRKIVLTEKGREAAKSIEDIALRIQTLTDCGISEEELLQFYSTLEKISANLSWIANDLSKNNK